LLYAFAAIFLQHKCLGLDFIPILHHSLLQGRILTPRGPRRAPLAQQVPFLLLPPTYHHRGLATSFSFGCIYHMICGPLRMCHW
jgi:hypothetical protein